MEKNIRTRGITLVFFIRYKMPQILIYERRNVGIGRQGRLKIFWPVMAVQVQVLFPVLRELLKKVALIFFIY